MRSSQKDLRAFPADAKAELGHSLYLVQNGDRPNNEKPLHDNLREVSELTADSENGNTYRSVFTVRLEPFLYVLHCFEKKSKSGAATPKKETDMIIRRLKEAKEDHAEWKRSQNAQKKR